MAKWGLGLAILVGALLLASPALARVRMVETKCPFEGVSVSLKVVGASGEYEGVMSEYAWLDRSLPGWKRTEQALITVGRRDYDLLTVRKGRKTQVLCFDITGFFGKSP